MIYTKMVNLLYDTCTIQTLSSLLTINDIYLFQTFETINKIFMYGLYHI